VTGPLSFAPAPDLGTALPRLNGESSETPRQDAPVGAADWRVVLGDCLDPVSGLASLPDKSVDHVISDPPYEAEAHTLQRRTKSTFVGSATSGEATGMLPAIKPISFAPLTHEIRVAAAAEMARVARRWIIVFCQAEAVQAWREALEAGGAVYKRACVWIKPDGQPQLTGDRPGMGYESIVAAHAPGRSRWNGGGKHGVYRFFKQAANDSTAGVEHPTRKPEPLMTALVRDFTDEGETVLDPFAGSGTTGVACRRLGRRFIGWERDPKYHAIATKRIDGAREQLGLRGIGP
jgi:site-specific DNA-methyltransferase (adenine-specific)